MATTITVKPGLMASAARASTVKAGTIAIVMPVPKRFSAPSSPTALGHTQGEGLPIEDLEYDAPGRFEAYWDGTDRSGAQVASGVYFVQLVVNGETRVRKMFVTK